MIRPLDAWTLAALLADGTLNGELQAVSEPFRRVTAYLAGLPVEARQGAWKGFLCGLPDPDKIVRAVADIDPTKPPPEADGPPERCATLADLRRLVAET